MKSAWLGLCIGFVLLQGCAPQKTEQGATDAGKGTSTATATSTGAPPQGGPTPEQMAKMPKSQQYFMQYQSAMQTQNTKAADELIGKAIASAKEEKNNGAYIMCVQQQASLKTAGKDNDGAIALLQNTIKDLDTPKSDPLTLMRLDPVKAMLAGLYAVTGKADKSEAIYKKGLEIAHAQKPVIHQRIAFWLRNYSDFFKYQKDTKKSDEMLKEATAELAKDPPAQGAGAPGGPHGAPGAPAAGGK
jgi:tetratricopeptide (TPR) repeat protein